MSNLVPSPTPGEPTMTSKQIAELLETRHDSVKRTVERLAERGTIVRPPMVDEQIEDVIGRPRVEWVYHIGKRDSFVVVAQLSPEFTARLVDRWQELEEAQPKPAAIDYSDPRVMLGLVSHLQGQVGEVQAQLTAQAPRIEALELIEGAVGWLCLTDAAKALKQSPKPFMIWLSGGIGWIYRRGGKGEWVAMQSKIDQKLMDSNPHTHRDGYGVNHVTYQAMVTPKGLAKLAEIIAALPGQKVPE